MPTSQVIWLFTLRDSHIASADMQFCKIVCKIPNVNKDCKRLAYTHSHKCMHINVDYNYNFKIKIQNIKPSHS